MKRKNSFKNKTKSSDNKSNRNEYIQSQIKGVKVVK